MKNTLIALLTLVSVPAAFANELVPCETTASRAALKFVNDSDMDVTAQSATLTQFRCTEATMNNDCEWLVDVTAAPNNGREILIHHTVTVRTKQLGRSAACRVMALEIAE